MAVNRIRYWLPVVFFMGYIFYASSRTGTDLPCIFPFQDVVFHFSVYALLAWSFGRALFFEKPGSSFFKIICLCAVFGLLYGISDEYHQRFVQGRTSDVFDVIVDTIGSFAGGIVLRWLK